MSVVLWTHSCAITKLAAPIDDLKNISGDITCAKQNKKTTAWDSNLSRKDQLETNTGKNKSKLTLVARIIKSAQSRTFASSGVDHRPPTTNVRPSHQPKFSENT